MLERPTYLDQVERMTKKMIDLKEKLNFTLVSVFEHDQNDPAEDTRLRTSLVILENHIDDLYDRVRD